jgi:hypothetical protein
VPFWRSFKGCHSLGVLSVVVISLWLRSGFPIFVIGDAKFDDALFVRLARSLGAGQWLGEYDPLTLAKGAFYPLFILFSFIAGIPLNLAEQALYLGACAIAARLVHRVAGRWPGLIVFAALAFNPVLLTVSLSRVIREAVYVSLSLALVALLVQVAFAGRNGSARWLFRALVRGFVLGAVFAAYWLTREEGPWLLPALAVVLLAAVPGWWRQPVLAGRTVVSLAGACVVGAALIGAVAAVNQAYYGRFLTNEFAAPEFQRAYGALARIHQDAWRRYVVFPADARQRAYAASPAAAELKPVLDGPIGEMWRRVGCEQTGIADCPEILSGWFMWALRSAVAQAGHARSSGEAMAFYQRLADEIDAACDRGTIPCDPPRATLMPPFRRHYLTDAAYAAVGIGRLLIGMGHGEILSVSSLGPRFMLLTFADMVGPIRPVDNHVRHVEGTIAGAPSMPVLGVRAGDNQATATAIDLTPPARSAADPSARHFSVTTNCPGACELVVGIAGQPDLSIPWTQLAPGDVALGSEARLSIESATDWEMGRASAARQGALLRIARAIGALYATAVPMLAGLGTLGLVVAVASLKKRPPDGILMALTVASLVAVICRIALLAYMDVSSFPAANILYVSPASPFVILFALTGTILGWNALSRRMTPVS